MSMPAASAFLLTDINIFIIRRRFCCCCQLELIARTAESSSSQTVQFQDPLPMS
jgi:hypothetical protein